MLWCRRRVWRWAMRGRWVWVWVAVWLWAWMWVGSILLLQPAFLLSYYCAHECLEAAMLSPPPPESPLVLKYIRRSVLASPQPHPPSPPTPIELDDPPWLDLGSWRYVETVIRVIFQHKRGGVFVEAGAGPGVFKSHTAWLEMRRGWQGLLVEPRTHAFQQLRQRRKAAAANACVSDQGHNKKARLWSPVDADLLPDPYRDLALSRSTLVQYVAPEDVGGGSVNEVQCYTLNALVWAWLGGGRHLDLLVLDTAGGEHRIFDYFENINISVAVVRHHTPVDQKYLEASAKLLDMEYLPGLVPPNTFYLFFMDHTFANYARKLNFTIYQA